MSERNFADGAGTRHFGIYPAIVTDIVDDEGLGRVEVRLPWLGDDGDKAGRAWATMVSPYADDDQGLQVMPEVGTQVVVAFEAGDLRRPYVLGATWNGKETMPSSPTAANNTRILKTRSGSQLKFEDVPAAAKITLSTANGHTLSLDDGTGQVLLQHVSGSSIMLDIAGKVTITATSMVDINAPVLNVHAATANFDGMITCTTVLPNTAVVSPLYTPGVGNIW
jgi:uncharacterized protein involved in type VI secretion and phage assembly